MRFEVCLVAALETLGAMGAISCGSSSGGTTGPHGCPSSVPPQNTPCPSETMTCEYQNGSDPYCTNTADCTGAGWEWNTCEMPGNSPQCPADFASVPKGQACNQDSLVCDYAQARCGCTVGAPPMVSPDGGAQAKWACDTPAAGCPTPRPHIGTTSCTTEGQMCDYGSCSIPGGVAEICKGGVWVEDQVACPAG